MTESTAAIEGADWSSRAAVWAEEWAGVAGPARAVVAAATGIRAGTRVLDVGCGSGEFCALAASRGADVSGIDAAEGMLAIARRRAPGADLRKGAIEALPWADRSFDVVSAFNSLQFAADFMTALREAARVARPGGRVAVCNWGRPEERDLTPVLDALGALQAPRAETPPPGPAERPALGEPGVLERLAGAAGLAPLQAGDVDVPYEAPDLATLERGFVEGAGFRTAVEHAGARAVHDGIAAAAAPFRRSDGSYRFENRFRYLIAEAERAQRV